jgi:DNA-directed RNA polymerase specialized sigma24 family protein
MSTSEDFWDAYARLQEKLASRDVADDYAWGLEATLNRLLNDPAASVADVERILGSETRKDRYRAALRRKYLGATPCQPSPDRTVTASLALAALQIHLAAEWELLRAVALGYTYEEIAAHHGTSAGALRVRVTRARTRARRLNS